jgi:hypothetical protein
MQLPPLMKNLHRLYKFLGKGPAACGEGAGAGAAPSFALILSGKFGRNCIFCYTSQNNTYYLVQFGHPLMKFVRFT